MSRPTARVLALLEILQSGGALSVADLARRLSVDERTVRRWTEETEKIGGCDCRDKGANKRF